MLKKFAKTIRLNNGIHCPVLGLGLSGSITRGPPQEAQTSQLIKDGISIGYRHFDTANNYQNERAVGQAITDCIKANKVKREELFLTTKIFYGIMFEKELKRGRSEALDYIRRATDKLNTSYVDLMLLHFPSTDTELDSQTWLGFEDALADGLVKSIGVSNFSIKQMEDLVKRANVIPAMNQVVSYPTLNQRQMIDWCDRYAIRVTAGQPLARGSLNDNPHIGRIGKKYNKSAAQVMIKWQIQRGIVAIPKTTNKERMKENFNVFDFNLTDDDMKVLENVI